MKNLRKNVINDKTILKLENLYFNYSSEDAYEGLSACLRQVYTGCPTILANPVFPLGCQNGKQQGREPTTC